MDVPAIPLTRAAATGSHLTTAGTNESPPNVAVFLPAFGWCHLRLPETPDPKYNLCPDYHSGAAGLSSGPVDGPAGGLASVGCGYKKNIAAELETALSIITTAYLRNEDIQTAVEENLEYLNPPVKSVFAEFLARIQLVDPDVDAALQDMGTKIDNAVFREWVAALLACQHDRGLKTILTPIVAKLSDMRIVNGELENMVFEPRKEFIIMQVLVVGNIPLLYFLNRDWFNTLMHTAMGQIILAVCAGVIFVSTAFVIKLTQPIEYRR